MIFGRGRPDWYDEAACQDTDPALFFPEPGEATDAGEAICRACLVAERCRAYAEAERFTFGVWGGELRGT